MLRRTLAAVLAALSTAAAALTGAPTAGAAGAVAAPGMPLLMADNLRCTMGFAASNAAGDALAVTAGHCGTPCGEVRDGHGTLIGRFVAVRPDDNRHTQYGYSIIALRRGVATSAAITRRLHILTTGHAEPGERVCLYGTTTGMHCGTVSSSTPDAGVIDGFASDHGDSGGPIVRAADAALVGILISHAPDGGHSYYEPITHIRSLAAATGDGGARFNAVTATGR